MRTAVTWWDDERITWYERAAEASSFHKNIAEEIKAMIRKEDRIEEEGCGLGHIAQILAADGYDIKACDADRKAIERARKRSSLDIFSVRDFRDPLPYADVLLMIYFGRIAENDSLDRLLEAAPAVIYILSHHRGQDTDMRAKKSNVEETITYLDSKGASYETKTVTYDFSQPCPESPAVDNSYFEDAAFVGDSRTEGFMLYSGIGCGEDLSAVGISIFKLADKKVLTIDGQKYTLLEALALKQYGKVYLCLGVNELGYNNDKGFYDAYCQAIDSIRACQPNAVIYIQGLIPLNENVIAATGGSAYLTNEHLRVYNDLMKQVAQEKQVVFLDLYPEFTGPDGQLPADASNDGVHLKKPYCQAWLEYLKTHTVSYDTLYPTQEAQA